MCGRYATSRSAADLSALFEAEDGIGDSLPPDFNVAPTDPVPIVRMSRSREGRLLDSARWGLVPHWSRDAKSGARMINARAETVASSSAFASSFARRRCLVPADGWFEWVRHPGQPAGSATARRAGKQAYYMTPSDGAPLAFAGLWSTWGEGTERLMTCSIVTTAAIGDLTLVHHRMPLILPRQRWSGWLAGGGEPAELLAPASVEFLAGIELRPVGSAVGDVRNDGPELVARVTAPPLAGPAEESVTLTLF